MEFSWKYKEQEYKEEKSEDFRILDLIYNVYACEQMKSLIYNTENISQENQTIRMKLLSHADLVYSNYITYIEYILHEIDECKINMKEHIQNELLNQLTDFADKFKHLENFTENISQINSNYYLIFAIPECRKVLYRLENRFAEYGTRINIYYWIEKVLISADKLVARRIKLVHAMPKTFRYRSNKNTIAQIVLADPIYIDYIISAYSNISSDANKQVNAFLETSVNDPDIFSAHVNAMNDYIATQYGFRNYRKDKPGCYTLMDINSKEYYAFSNLFDVDAESAIAAYFNIGSDMRYKSLRDAVHKLGASILPGATWLKTIGETKRYFRHYTINSLTKDIEIEPNLGPNDFVPITPGQTLNDAMDASNSELYIKELRSSFNCCERKMFANIIKNSSISVSNVKLFSRHTVCQKCQPAIDEFKKYYSLDDTTFKVYCLDSWNS